MLHGKKEAINSQKTAQEVFSDNSSGSNLPSLKFDKKILNKEINIIDLIFLSKLENSKSEIRRLIKGDAIKINNKIIKDEKYSINKKTFDEKFIKLSIGKKRHLKIELN
jgi:tyrosyl-tRNA synthetase